MKSFKRKYCVKHHITLHSSLLKENTNSKTGNMRGELIASIDGSIRFSFDRVRPRRGGPEERKEYYFEFQDIHSPGFVLFLLDNLLDEELCDVIDACAKRLRLKVQAKTDES